MLPTPHDIVRLAAQGIITPRTVARFFRNPSSVSSITVARIKKAAGELGIALPVAETGDVEPVSVAAAGGSR